MSWECYCPEAIAKSLTDAHDFTTPGSAGPHCAACGRHRDEAISYNEAMRMLSLAQPFERTLLGLQPVDVAPDSSVVCEQLPQRTLRIVSMLVDYASAEAFELHSLCIGHREFGTVGGGVVPLSMMGVEVEGWPRAYEVGGKQEDGPDLWDRAVALQGERVRLVLRNASTKPARFRGVLRVEVSRDESQQLA